MSDISVSVSGLSKKFVLYHNAASSLKQHFVGLLHPRWRPRREEFTALQGISFSLRKGEALALLGHNGSGKSTLLQILAGVMAPTSGRFATTGRVAPMIELGVGFHPELTGEENIYLNASLYGLSNEETRERYDEIVAFSGLGKFIDTPVKNYSSGMYMRLGFSVAVHVDPDILLADEILAVGDATFQDKCHRKIREMQHAGMTLILVTHSMQQARQFCGRYIRLEHGRVIGSGIFDDQEAANA